jgi:hypothetical protein
MTAEQQAARDGTGANRRERFGVTVSNFDRAEKPI